jgi:hypothetical protein
MSFLTFNTFAKTVIRQKVRNFRNIFIPSPILFLNLNRAIDSDIKVLNREGDWLNLLWSKIRDGYQKRQIFNRTPYENVEISFTQKPIWAKTLHMRSLGNKQIHWNLQSDTWVFWHPVTFDNFFYYTSCKFPVFSLVKECVPI